MDREERGSLRGPEGQLEDVAVPHDAPERRIQHSMIQEVYKQRDELLALIRKTMRLATFVIPKERERPLMWLYV